MKRFTPFSRRHLSRQKYLTLPAPIRLKNCTEGEERVSFCDWAKSKLGLTLTDRRQKIRRKNCFWFFFSIVFFHNFEQQRVRKTKYIYIYLYVDFCIRVEMMENFVIWLISKQVKYTGIKKKSRPPFLRC